MRYFGNEEVESENESGTESENHVSSQSDYDYETHNCSIINPLSLFLRYCPEIFCEYVLTKSLFSLSILQALYFQKLICLRSFVGSKISHSGIFLRFM